MRRPYNAIDGIRCVLICLVVVVHIVNFGRLYPGVKEAVNFFFMPAFLLVTGYLVNVSVSLRQFGVYVLRIALPYVFLSLGFAVLSLWMPVEGGLSSFSLGDVAGILLFKPIGPYWFLHAMIVCGCVYYAAFRLGRRFGVGCVLCVMGSLLALVVWATPLLAFVYAVFYFLGAALRLSGVDFLRFFAPCPWALLPFAVVLVCCCPSGGGLSVAALSACFFCFVSWGWGRLGGRAASIVGFVGRNTLPVYLFHPVFTMIAKLALPLFAFDPTGLVHTAFTVALAVSGSLAVGWALDVSGGCRLFARKSVLR